MYKRKVQRNSSCEIGGEDYDSGNVEITYRKFIFEILLIAVVLDTILGVLRAIKEHKFNFA